MQFLPDYPKHQTEITALPVPLTGHDPCHYM